MNEPDQSASESVDGASVEGGSPLVSEAPQAMFVCPYCGSPTPDVPRCVACRGFLDPLSRQASQNAMGPWFIRNPDSPFQIGCSYETITAMVMRGRVTLDSILRGPTTSQFWSPAKRVPGVAHLLGVCHSCGAGVHPEETFCPECRVEFWHDPDRQYMGLMPLRAIPGQPLPVAAEHARAESRVEVRSVGAEPSESAVRHIEALEGNVRWLWGWLIGVMAVLGVVVAVLLAAMLGGFVTFGSGGGVEATPATAGKAAGNAAGEPMKEGVREASPERPSVQEPPRGSQPVGAPAREEPPAAKDTGKDASGPVRPAAEGGGDGGGAAASSEGVRKARELMKADTDESLAEAIKLLEPLAKSGDMAAGTALQAARARVAQKAMRGVR